jgi:hypothetical protein
MFELLSVPQRGIPHVQSPNIISEQTVKRSCTQGVETQARYHGYVFGNWNSWRSVRIPREVVLFKCQTLLTSQRNTFRLLRHSWIQPVAENQSSCSRELGKHTALYWVVIYHSQHSRLIWVFTTF